MPEKRKNKSPPPSAAPVPPPPSHSVDELLFNIQADLAMHRLYLVQLLCITAGKTDDAKKFVNSMYDVMTDSVLGTLMPQDVSPEAAKAFRRRMQETNRAIITLAASSVARPDNPAERNKVKR